MRARGGTPERTGVGSAQAGHSTPCGLARSTRPRRGRSAPSHSETPTSDLPSGAVNPSGAGGHETQLRVIGELGHLLSPARWVRLQGASRLWTSGHPDARESLPTVEREGPAG